MKLIKPSFEILEPHTALMGEHVYNSPELRSNAIIDAIEKDIERAARVCYKSESNITDTSAKAMVKRLIENRHLAMLEHGTVYFTLSSRDWLLHEGLINRLFPEKCPYAKVNNVSNTLYITTNYRYIIENGLDSDFINKYITTQSPYHSKRVTVKYICNIHFYKDCTRHRVFSWAIESTRFCNYVKEKFGSAVSFILPNWLTPEEYDEVIDDFETLEQIYFKWIKRGWQPQQAATFLPQATKSEVIMTGFVDDFKHFFALRADGTTGKPHPQVEELVKPLKEEFTKRNYI